MNRFLLIICIICNFTNFCCSQHSKKNLPKVEANPELADDFFNSETYSRSPSSIKVFRNDTLMLDTTYTVITEKEVNAFVEDRYNKKFSLSECFGTAIKDTMLIEFRNDMVKDYLLSIKIVKGYFNSRFIENSSIANSWTPVKERLVLNNMNFKNDQEVKGIVEIEFVLIDGGVKKDSAFFYGPFYYKISVPPVIRTVQSQ